MTAILKHYWISLSLLLTVVILSFGLIPAAAGKIWTPPFDAIWVPVGFQDKWAGVHIVLKETFLDGKGQYLEQKAEYWRAKDGRWRFELIPPFSTPPLTETYDGLKKYTQSFSTPDGKPLIHEDPNAKFEAGGLASPLTVGDIDREVRQGRAKVLGMERLKNREVEIIAQEVPQNTQGREIGKAETRYWVDRENFMVMRMEHREDGRLIQGAEIISIDYDTPMTDDMFILR